MTFVSVLAVFGSTGTENKSDKFQKLFYDGLVTALGSYASDVDAVVATSAPPSSLTETEKYGTALVQTLCSGAPLRVLFQPELRHFQTAFDETIAEAVDAVGSGVAVVVVVYAGEVLHTTGEWLLADSTFSGEQLQMWLDSNAAAAWQPEIQKLTSAPSGTEPIHIVVCTPSAGAKTRWPIAATPGDSTHLVMLSKSRRLPVRLQTTASWRANGKLASSPSNATSYEALHSLSADLARLHWEHQSKLLAEGEKEFILQQRSFKEAPPALYLLPSGPGGVQTQACGLFVVQGVNVLLGSAFTDNKPPQWWPLVRSLDRLDAAVFPDWSAASIQSYRFLSKHLLHATSASYCANWLGCLFTPPLTEPGGESPLLLTPPTTATAAADPHRLRQLPALPDKTRLFYKIGVGELILHCLGPSVGVLLVWHPAAGGVKTKKPPTLTIFLPVVQPSEAGTVSTSPVNLLAGLVRTLRKVPEIALGETSAVAATSLTKKTTLPSTATRQLGVTTKTVNSTPPPKTHVNGAIKHITPTATPTATKPLASKSTPTRTIPSRASAPKSAALPKTVPSTTPKTKITPATPRSAPSATRPATAATTPRPRLTPSTTARPATTTVRKTTQVTKKPTAEKGPTAISKTEAKLTEHAAKVAKATAAKPGHEIKYAPAGRPSNLPPRRKVGEKTVMEELDELPEEVLKTPTTDSLAEAGKQPQPGHETEEEISYPDSLHAEESGVGEGGKTPDELEVAKSPVNVEHKEVVEEVSTTLRGVDLPQPDAAEGHDFGIAESKSPTKPDFELLMHPAGGAEPRVSPVELASSKLEEELSKSPALPDDDQHGEYGYAEVPDDSTGPHAMPATAWHPEVRETQGGMEFALPPGVPGFNAEQALSKSPVAAEISTPPPADTRLEEHIASEDHEEMEDSQTPRVEAKSPIGGELLASPVSTDLGEHHAVEPHDVFDLSKVSAGAPFALSPDDIGAHKELGLAASPVGMHFGESGNSQEEEEAREKTPQIPTHYEELEQEARKSPIGVDFPATQRRDEHAEEGVGSYGSDVDAISPGINDEIKVSGTSAEQHEEPPVEHEIFKAPADRSFAMPALSAEQQGGIVAESPVSPGEVGFSAHPDAGHHVDSRLAESPVEPGISTAAADIDFAMPTLSAEREGGFVAESPVLHGELGLEAHLHAGKHEESEFAQLPMEPKISKSPAGMDFAMPALNAEEQGGFVAESPMSHGEMGLDVHPHFGEHEEPELAESPVEPGISKSAAGMDFAMPAWSAEQRGGFGAESPVSPGEMGFSAHPDAGHHADSRLAESPVEPGISTAAAGMDFAMPVLNAEEQRGFVAESPMSHGEMGLDAHPHAEEHEEMRSVESPAEHGISKLPADTDFAIPTLSAEQQKGFATEPGEMGFGVHSDADQHKEMELAASPVEHEISKSPADVDFAEKQQGLVAESPVSHGEVGLEAHPHAGEHEEPELAESQVEHEISKSPTGMNFAMPALNAEHQGGFVAESPVSPGEMGFSAHPRLAESPMSHGEMGLDVNSGAGQHEESGLAQWPVEHEISKAPGDMSFAMPALNAEEQRGFAAESPVSQGEVVDFAAHPEGGRHEEAAARSAESPMEHEISKSPAGMDFAMPALNAEEQGGFVAESPMSHGEMGLDVHPHFGEHEEPELAESPVEPGISKSPAGMDFAMPALSTEQRGGFVAESPVSPGEMGFSAHPDAGHHVDSRLAESPVEPGISESPAGMDFAMPALSAEGQVGFVAESPMSHGEMGLDAHLHAGKHEESECAQSPVEPEISKSPADMDFAMPALSAEQPGDFVAESPRSPGEMGLVGHHEKSELAESPMEPENGVNLSPPTSHPDGLGPFAPMESLSAARGEAATHSDIDDEAEVAPSTLPMAAQIPRLPAHADDAAVDPKLSSSPVYPDEASDIGYPRATGMPQFLSQFHSHPPPTTTTTTTTGGVVGDDDDDEFPVHEVNVGGAKVIPEVSDHVDSTEGTAEEMPPIHCDLMYQSQPEYASQPADSTTHDAPQIGFITDPGAGRALDENIHSPSSEVSNDSVIHTGAVPIPAGFISDIVSSTNIATSPNSGAPSGFSSQHPLLYSQRPPSQGVEEEQETGLPLHQKSPLAPAGETGGLDIPRAKSPISPHQRGANGLEDLDSGEFTNGTTAAEKSGDADSATSPFDPLAQWGHPQNMPAPVAPTRTTLAHASRPKFGLTTSSGSKSSAPQTASKAPDSLPPGPALHLDVVWVPGYIIRVPFAMATQFFTQVRARIYVLSGECLHPIAGEALIAGVSKWTPEEREAVANLSGGRGVAGINVVPTDEPLEWVRWLRRSSGGDGSGATGEERLQAAGVSIHSSATLCDIHFSDNGTEVTCPGTQLPV